MIEKRRKPFSFLSLCLCSSVFVFLETLAFFCYSFTEVSFAIGRLNPPMRSSSSTFLTADDRQGIGKTNPISNCQIFLFAKREKNKVYIQSEITTFSFLFLFFLYSSVIMPVQRGLAKECQQHFQTSNLYEIFSLHRTANEAQGTNRMISFEIVSLLF